MLNPTKDFTQVWLLTIVLCIFPFGPVQMAHSADPPEGGRGVEAHSGGMARGGKYTERGAREEKSRGVKFTRARFKEAKFREGSDKKAKRIYHKFRDPRLKKDCKSRSCAERRTCTPSRRIHGHTPRS